MGMGRKNGAQRFLIVAGSLHLVYRGLPQTIERQGTLHPRQGVKLLGDVTAKTGIDEQVALWVLYQSSGHGKVTWLKQRASAITEGSYSMVHASH